MKIVKQRKLNQWRKSFAWLPVSDIVLEKETFVQNTVFLEHYWQRQVASRQDRSVKTQIMTKENHYRMFVAETVPAFFNRKTHDGHFQEAAALFIQAYAHGHIDYTVEGVSEIGGQFAHILEFMRDAEKFYSADGSMGEDLVTSIFGTTPEEYAADKLNEAFAPLWASAAKTVKLPVALYPQDICTLITCSKFFKGYHWARQVEYMNTLFNKNRIAFIANKQGILTQINILKPNKTVDLEIKLPA